MLCVILEVSGVTPDHEWRLEGDTVVNGVTIPDSVKYHSCEHNIMTLTTGHDYVVNNMWRHNM